MGGDLVNLLADLKENEALNLVQERLNAGDDPMDILNEARKAMEIVGKRYDECTYFIPDLVYSGKILEAITEMVKVRVTRTAETKSLGKVLMGTVAGDIHDIGKNIVTFLLDVNGFHVLDLGVDVPAKKFVEAIEEFEPDIVGLSCLLTLAFDSMKETIQTIQEAGLRDKVKIMIGGGVVDSGVVDYVKADAYEPFAGGAVRLSKEWVGVG
jgi:5-methyltetrahydrofolate--homocysteine methyltransferase